MIMEKFEVEFRPNGAEQGPARHRKEGKGRGERTAPWVAQRDEI